MIISIRNDFNISEKTCTYIIIDSLKADNNIQSFTFDELPNHLKSIFFGMFSSNNYINTDTITGAALIISERGKISLDEILTLKYSNVYADFSDLAKDNFIKTFCSGCREKTKNKIYSALTFTSLLKNYGCFSRVMYEPKTEKWSYTACQSYKEEIKIVRDCFLD